MATKPWRPAKSLDVLRYQINSAYPGRNKASDGTIGDAAHAKSKSEHNPDANGVVRALDITHDPDKGVDCGRIIDAMVASRDPRILYVIWNRRICSSRVQPWKWRAYSGSNPHDKHFHLSVVDSPTLYDNEGPWAIGTAAIHAPPEPPAPPPVKPTAPSPVQPGHDAGSPETAGDPASVPSASPAGTVAIGGAAIAGGAIAGSSGGSGAALWIGAAVFVLALIVGAVVIFRRKE